MRQPPAGAFRRRPSPRSARLLLCVFSALGAVGLIQACCPRTKSFAPRPGDLLFQDLDRGPLCDAIERVTQGYRGARFSHVGIVAPSNKGNLVVIEAVSKGVRATPLAEFLARSHDAAGRPKVVVGRLRRRHRRLVPRALDEATARLGKPYDPLFVIGNDRYYCSELVYEALRAANGGPAFFPLEPMTFKDPQTGHTLPAWTAYFRKHNAPIPEGNPGINPGAISRSPEIEIVHVYGSPDGW